VGVAALERVKALAAWAVNLNAKCERDAEVKLPDKKVSVCETCGERHHHRNYLDGNANASRRRGLSV